MSVDKFVNRVILHGLAPILYYALFTSIHSPGSIHTVAGRITAAYVPSAKNRGIPCTPVGTRG